MATALFIKRADLVKNTALNGSVDTDKFIQFIHIAQEIHVRNYMGTDLYDKISQDIIAGDLTGDYLALVNDYIQPMLIHYAMAEYLPFAAYTIANGGVYTIISFIPRMVKGDTHHIQVRSIGPVGCQPPFRYCGP